MNVHKTRMPSLSSWYADGLRWIGSLLHAAADRVEQASLDPLPLEPHPELLPSEDHMFHLRHRIQSRNIYY